MAGAADKKTSIGSGWNARILELFKLSPAQEMQQMGEGGQRFEVKLLRWRPGFTDIAENGGF